MDGTYLTSGAQTPISGSEPFDMSVRFATGTVEGFVRGPAAGFDVALSLTDSLESILFAGTSVEGSYSAGGRGVHRLARRRR